MATATNSKTETGHLAVARALNLPVSTKHCIEICRTLRYKEVSYAKQFLEEVVQLKRAVPFKRFVMNTGHKKGMSTGRYPVKAAAEVLRLLKSAEANAHFKGLNTESLKITKLVANKASIPFTGGRHRTGTKRTHLEMEVKERFAKKKEMPKEVKETREEVKKAEPVAAPTVKKEVQPIKTETAKETVARKEPKTAKEEPSSEELLRRAQQKAAELKKREKERKETEEVSHLYQELQKKGSLRSASKSTGGRK